MRSWTTSDIDLIFTFCFRCLAVKSRRMRWVGNITRMEGVGMRNLYNFFIGKREGKRHLERPSRRKRTLHCVLKIAWGWGVWTLFIWLKTLTGGGILMARRWTLGFHKSFGDLLASWAIVNLSLRSLYYGVVCRHIFVFLSTWWTITSFIGPFPGNPLPASPHFFPHDNRIQHPLLPCEWNPKLIEVHSKWLNLAVNTQWTSCVTSKVDTHHTGILKLIFNSWSSSLDII